MSEIKKEKAITLIALIITIIVLLILGGIVLNMVVGENGIYKKSLFAKEKNDYATAKETIAMKLMEIYSKATTNDKLSNVTLEYIAQEMKEAEYITITKYYNAIGTVKEGINENLINLEGISVVDNNHPKYNFLIGKKCKIEGVREGNIDDISLIGDFIEISDYEKNYLGKSNEVNNTKFSISTAAQEWLNKASYDINSVEEVKLIIKSDEIREITVEDLAIYPDFISDVIKNEEAIKYMIENEDIFKLVMNNQETQKIVVKSEKAMNLICQNESAVNIIKELSNAKEILENSEYYEKIFGIDGYTVLYYDFNGNAKDRAGHISTIVGNISYSDDAIEGKSAYFNGGSYVRINQTEECKLGNVFTIDWWEKRENSGTVFYTGYIGSSDGCLLLTYDGSFFYCSEVLSGWSIFNGATAFSNSRNEWVHWALVRDGDKFTTYKNGKQYWTGTSSKKIGYSQDAYYNIGRYRDGDANTYKGYIDNFRVTIGLARWTSDFNINTDL